MFVASRLRLFQQPSSALRTSATVSAGDSGRWRSSARMAAAPSGRSDNELRWESLIAEAHAAFLQTCSLKLSEPFYHAPYEEFLSAVVLLAPQPIRSLDGETKDFNAHLTSSALNVDASLSRLSLAFEAMEDFLDEVSLCCGTAWQLATTCATDSRDEAVARAAEWSSLSIRMSQQQMAIDCMRMSVAAMLDGSCEVAASQAAFGEIVQLQHLQAEKR